jgi:hypothetical protein
MNSVHSEKETVADGMKGGEAVEGAAKAPGHETLVDAVFDLGLSWAEFGVSQGKQALTHSAKTLERVAKSLDDLQKRLRKD